MTIDVAEGRRLKAAEEATAHAVLQSGAAAERVALWRARGAWAQWLDANLATLLDAAERVEAAERERDEARIELRRMQAGELPGGWTEELNAAIEARYWAERERDEARELLDALFQYARIILFDPRNVKAYPLEHSMAASGGKDSRNDIERCLRAAIDAEREKR